MAQVLERISKSLKKYSARGEGDCILWTGSCDRYGYGRKKVTWGFEVKKMESTHRLAYMVSHNLTELPRENESGDFMEVSHLCHRKRCINPDHLVFEPHSVNMSRASCFIHCCCSLEHSPACIF